MSCGRPHETDCAEILDRIYLFLDDEMDGGPESYALVERHLDECGPCLSQYDLERVLRALVARSCGGEHAPPELRQRVLTRIRSIRVEVAGAVEL